MGREEEMAEGEVMGNIEKKRREKDDEQTGLFLLKVQSFPGRIGMCIPAALINTAQDRHLTPFLLQAAE